MFQTPAITGGPRRALERGRTAAIFALILLFGFSRPTWAQSTTDSSTRAVSSGGEIRGRIVGLGTGQPITTGSVSVLRASDSSVVTGANPESDGSFHIAGIKPGRYSVRVRALGFAPLVRSDVTVSAEQPVADLGTLTLSEFAVKLESQTVTGERPDVALSPDRNSYSTRNMTTASGGTAVDVLRNVPSVEVDGNNNVTLRGNSNVVVQINGRASPLSGEQLAQFLAQIPASTVTRVEVATNPSAKNDPEGSAGIINIILNQQADLGLSGGFNAGTGTTGQVNTSGNIGRQSGPLTLYLSASLYRDHRTRNGSSDRTNLAIPVPAFVESNSEGTSVPRWNSLMFRSEYKLTENDALSLDAMASGGRFASQNSAFYSDLDADREVIGLFNQYSDQVWRSVSRDFTLGYHRTAGPSMTILSTELRYSNNTNSSDNNLFGVLVQADTSTGSEPPPRERDASRQRMPSWNLQTDYTHPFGAKTKLETGFKGTLRSNADNSSVTVLDPTSGEYTADPSRANIFDYHERIGAIYGVLSQQVGKVQTQAGLRLEEAATRFTLPAIGQSFDNHYSSAYPSAILSYNFTDMRQLKLSYSRRVSRPNPWQLSPIVDRSDARHEFHGNPSLRPEYTDAFELAFQDAHPWGSLQLNPYLRSTSHAVRYIQTIDTAGISVSTFDNVASTLTTGADLNMTYRHSALTFFGGGSIYHYSSDASNLAGNLSTNAFVWSLRANATLKFSPVTDFQAFANYRAPSATEGGSQSAFVFMNFALRRKLWGDKGSVTLRVADPFNLMTWGYRTADGRVIESNEQHFGQRGLFVTLSRTFGQQLKLRPQQQEGESQGPPQPGPP
jgi:outer membrane receptor protein involved in Fe transport